MLRLFGEEYQHETPVAHPVFWETSIARHGCGRTGSTGFDVLRWKWITYHLDGQAMQYTVRWGDTIESIAYDWEISPQSILGTNQFQSGIQLSPV